MQATDISVKLLKKTSCLFPTALEYVDLRSAYKKDNKTDKESYRPISILTNLSKSYERFMYEIFLKLGCGCRKGFSTQQRLTHMIEK